MKKNADLIIKNATLWRKEGRGGVMVDASIAVADGSILKVGSRKDLSDVYTAPKTWDAGGKLLLPGFINTHCHLFQVFMRGLGKDLPFMDWMNQSVRLLMPLLDDEAVYLAAMVGCMEAIRTGTTTLVDFMYANVKPCLADAVLRAFDDCGIRGVLARGLTDIDKMPGTDRLPVTWQPVPETLADVDRLRAMYARHPRITFALAPSVIWAMTSQGLTEGAAYARTNDMVYTMHLLETADDDQFSLERYGKRTTTLLEELGIMAPNFLAVHAVRLEPEDFERFERYQVKVSHNPVANMILGSGAAPVRELNRRGIPIGLGTDGAASNDSQSLIEVMKSAALLQKVSLRDPAALSADQVFAMATKEGAMTIGMADQIGTLQPGKRADILVVDLDRPNTTPCFDPIASLVYSGDECNIHSVFIEGDLVLEAGAFTRFDEAQLIARANQKAQALYRDAQEK
ncbi:MAG: amidohydrolase [Anaerolineae bacterium]|nr:amidohydrolase [Anaerolineae bacterium]